MKETVETKRSFLSASGICQNGYVIVTITRLQSPLWICVTGSIGNDPFIFGAGVLYGAIKKTLDGLFERHPLSRDEINEAITDALAMFAKEAQ